jgi:hypothetical protein
MMNGYCIRNAVTVTFLYDYLYVKGKSHMNCVTEGFTISILESQLLDQ